MTRKWIALGLAAAAALAAPTVVSAATTHDLRGDWRVCGPDTPPGTPCSAADQLWSITAMDLSSGAFSGQGRGTPPNDLTFDITGKATGDSFEMDNPHHTITYSPHWTGTIAPDNNSMSGTWTEGGQSGTWYANRTSGPPAGGGSGAGDPSKRPSGTAVSCNRGPQPSSPWTCFATVGDAGTGAASAPGGTVTFATSHGGTFNFGPTCVLASNQSSPAVTGCSVTYTSAGPGTVITATYGGDGAHNGSEGTFTIYGMCTDPVTLKVTCADPSGDGGTCAPRGPVFSQCRKPIVAPVVCGPSGTILVACQSQGPLILACGGFGTILPQCTGAPDPVLVCGPSGTILPECRFAGPISATPLDVDAGTGSVTATIGCPGALARRPAARAAGEGRAAEDDRLCEATFDAAATQARLREELHRTAVTLSRAFTRRAAEIPLGPGEDPTLRAEQGKRNAAAFVARADKIIDALFGPGGDPVPPGLSDRVWLTHLAQQDVPAYIGPPTIWSDFSAEDNPSPKLVKRILDAVIDYGRQSNKRPFGTDRTDYRHRLRLPSAEAGAAARRRACPARRAALRSIRVRRGRRARVHIRFSRAAVRRLVRCVAPGTRVVPVRLVISFKAQPRPVARFYELRLRIKR